MLWVLWDIVLPLIATFLLGLFIGWMLWRWRRKRIDADDLSALRRSSARYKADAERLELSNIELSDRLQAASSAGGGDLANARRRIDMLSEELKGSRTEVAELKRTHRGGTADADGTAEQLQQLESRAQSAEEQLASYQQSSGSSLSVDHLHREIKSRDRMIATLRSSLDQFGESGDNTALMADVELRDREISDLKDQLARLKN